LQRSPSEANRAPIRAGMLQADGNITALRKI
jgi:hypothetical protein